MEVVGVVAGVPALVKIIKSTITLVYDVSNSKKAVSKITKGLDSQLQALAGALEQIKIKQTSALVSVGQMQKLEPLIHQLYEQLKGLNEILSAAQGRGPLGRMKMLVRGLEKRLKDHMQRLETSISLLNLNLVEITLKLSEETASATRLTKRVQLKDLLKPCNHDFIPRKLSGTLGWVTSHPTICKWRQPPEDEALATDPLARLLIIHGGKGCGKSVLSASLAHDLQTAGLACAVFVFYHGIERQKKQVAMLCSILWQLLHVQEAPDKVVDQICDSLVSNARLTEESLLASLDRVMSVFKKRTYLIIDGVDESADDWNDDDGPWRVIRAWLANYPLVHILLVGRKPAFHMVLGAAWQDNIVELSQDITNSDITTFIAHKLQGCRNLDDLSDELRLHVREKLQDKSTGMFLWVDLAFKELRKCHSPAALRDCLAELPRSLDDEYCRLFGQVFRRLSNHAVKPSVQAKVARTLLALIVGAIEPLSVEELRYAYAVLCENGPSWRDHLISQDAVLEFLGDFVSFKSDHVNFSHASVEEFLTRPLDEWIGCPQDVVFFRLDPEECQQIIGNACLQYLHVADFGFPLTDDSYRALIRKPFLGYATKQGSLHWAQMISADPTAFASMVDKLKAFIATAGFVGLIEFFLSGLLHDVDFAEEYGLFLMTFGQVFGEELLPPLTERLAAEDGRRRDTFGTRHERTVSWNVLIGDGLLEALYSGINAARDNTQDEHGAERPSGHHNSATCSSTPSQGNLVAQSNAKKELAAPKGSAGASVSPSRLHQLGYNPVAMVSSIPSNFKAIVHLPSMCRVLQLWTDPREIHRRAIAAMVEKMPLLLVFFLGGQLMRIGDQEGARKLFKLTVKRTHGQKNCHRVAALWFYCYVLADEEIYQAERDGYFAEISTILSSHPDSPIAQILKQLLAHQRIETLSYLGSVGEVERLVSELIQSQAQLQESSTAIRKFTLLKSFLYKRSWWIKAENSCLKMAASTLGAEDLFQDAHRLWQHLSERQRMVFEPHHAEIIRAQLRAGNMLYKACKYAEAEQQYKATLKEHDEERLSESARPDMASGLFMLGGSVFSQGRHSEALAIFRSARAYPGKESMMYWRLACTKVISKCLQQLGDFEAAKAEMETVKMEKYVRLFRKGWFKSWNQLWWHDLCTIYGHLGEQDKIIALRRTIQRLLGESSKYIKHKKENLWALMDTLDETEVYDDAVKVAQDLIKLLESTPDRQLPRIQRERELMDARAELLYTTGRLDRSGEIESIEEEQLRYCLEDLNRRQGEGTRSARVVRTNTVKICYEAAEELYGPDHMCTIRFHEHLETYTRMDRCWDEESLEEDEGSIDGDVYSASEGSMASKYDSFDG